jgi:adenylyltransferase/sulfurtransferase
LVSKVSILSSRGNITRLTKTGQLRLHAASVLIVGAGGLGCPAAAYISGAGVKCLGIVDGDKVEVSNLHRQILHNSSTIGSWKVDSAIRNLSGLNPNIEYKAYREHLSPENAANIVSHYDIVLDCTDHPKSRYLISDICVLLQKPLVSASALRTDGQLMVLNYPANTQGSNTGGPCYRCIFPKPPPANQVVSCGDGGIFGPVVGVMGVLQALEAIKLLIEGLKVSDISDAELHESKVLPSPSLLLFSANSPSPFRTVRLRPRRPDCFACSSNGGLTLESVTSGSLDYVAFCGSTAPVELLSSEEQISAKQYSEVRNGISNDHVLLDVREKVQFDICNIDGSINVPFSKLQGRLDTTYPWLPERYPADAPIYVICRLGNDSQVITRKLKESGLDDNGRRSILEIKGGLRAWKKDVDSSWPEY